MLMGPEATDHNTILGVLRVQFFESGDESHQSHAMSFTF